MKIPYGIMWFRGCTTMLGAMFKVGWFSISYLFTYWLIFLLF
jgi:hypothetical protein